MDKAKDFEKGWEEYKAKKKQEIEEMVKIIQKAVGGCAEHWAKLIAEELHKNRYRKIPENAVVLTREEFESLGLVVETVQEYESQNGQPVLVKERKVVKKLQTDFTELLNQEIRELQLAQTRKETAEKFAERLKEKLEENSPIAGYDLEDLEFDGETIQECIEEICKEITEGKV